ncbi:YceI family protein [Haloferula sp.]|uniref:YceI family protein n=1 Tax=Haloferula sp. TaxID=2497595 RepID=UPI003C76A687
MKRLIGAALCGMLMMGIAGADTLKVDKTRSRIQVDGRSTGHGFTGTLEEYTARVSGNPVTLRPDAFELSWKFTDLKTEDEKRDKEMIKWLGGGSPTGTFKFIKTWEQDGKDFAQGTISIHGVSKLIAFPYTVKKDGDWVSIDGVATLDYKDFGLPIIRAVAVMTVNPKLTVRFHLVGKL